MSGNAVRPLRKRSRSWTSGELSAEIGRLQGRIRRVEDLTPLGRQQKRRRRQSAGGAVGDRRASAAGSWLVEDRDDHDDHDNHDDVDEDENQHHDEKKRREQKSPRLHSHSADGDGDSESDSESDSDGDTDTNSDAESNISGDEMDRKHLNPPADPTPPDPDLVSIFECPVCRQLLLNPVTLKCGHSLCEECMIQFLENGTGRCKCPAGCQTAIPFHLPPVNVTLRHVLQKKFPELTSEREKDEGQLFMRKEMLANASAISTLLRDGTEGRPLENVRRDIHFMRTQDILVRDRARRRSRLNQEDHRREGGGGVAGESGAPGAGGHGDGDERVFSLPFSAVWMTTLMVCTMWAFLREGNGEVLMLDWQRVTVNKEFWRLLTTFTTLGNRKDLSLNVFSLFRLYFQKHYEPDIGTKKYLGILSFGVAMLLARSYVFSEDMLAHTNTHLHTTATTNTHGAPADYKLELGNNIHDSKHTFLAHDLIFYMFINYCVEKPLLFLVMLWLAQLESFVHGNPWQNLTMFVMMLLPRLPTLLMHVYHGISEVVYGDHEAGRFLNRRQRRAGQRVRLIVGELR